MIHPGDTLTIPASWPVRIRVKAVKSNPRSELIQRLYAYSGPHVCRKLFLAAAMALESDCDALTLDTIRRQLANIDKRRDAKAKRLASDAAKFMEAA